MAAGYGFTSTALFSLIAWLSAVCSAMAEELCSYMTNDYNMYDRRWEQMVSYKTCQWGCCWKFEDPCCSTPVGLIIGCSIGALILLSLAILAICCCCCRKSSARPGVVVSYADSRVAFSSSSANQTASLPPGVYAPPPSYDEVMSGQYTYGNPTFKADTIVQ